MDRTRLLLVGKLLGGVGLFSAGAGGYFLFSPPIGEKIRIKSWSFVDNGRITEGVENLNKTSKLTRVHEYRDKGFFHKCNREVSTKEDANSESCYNYIETKADGGHPIRLFKNEDQMTHKMEGWQIYKFIYRKNPEDGEIEEYYGQCMPIDIESIYNPCATNNLPNGWTKHYEKNIPVTSSTQ